MADQLPLSELQSQTSTSDTEKNMRGQNVNIHREYHTKHGDLIRDSIIGFSDGLTVPFALTAGLSSLGSSRIVILGGLAELFAGSISMGLGAFLASITDRKHYIAEEQREWKEVRERPQEEEDEIYEIFEKYGIQRHESKGVVDGLKANEDMWVQVSCLLQRHTYLNSTLTFSPVHDGLRAPTLETLVEPLSCRRACDGCGVLCW